ncbi:MAG: hypothetical protein HZA17_00230 [Nitrospirae bacterium]|nr:hypothetical protein [Nitrospirota bacterium]
MGTDMRMFVILLFSPLVIVTVHAVCSRIYHDRLPQTVAVRALILGYLPMAVFLWKGVFRALSCDTGAVVSICYCFVVYTSCAYAYFHLFNMSETARRIRIIHEIHKAGSLQYNSITALYRTPDIIRLRLKRLVGMKRLTYRDGYYSLNDRLLYRTALFIALWRTLLGFSGRRVE